MVGAYGTDWINSPMIVSLPIFTHFGRGSNSNLHKNHFLFFYLVIFLFFSFLFLFFSSLFFSCFISSSLFFSFLLLPGRKKTSWLKKLPATLPDMLPVPSGSFRNSTFSARNKLNVCSNQWILK